MTSLESAFEKACEDGTLAGAALLAATTDKGIVYSKAFGKRSLEKDAQDMAIDDVMQLYSATKLVTSISAMQLAERGLFTLDEDVSRVLPEIGGLKVLTRMNGSEPVFEEPKSKVTLRQLLSHSSGLAYPFLSPTIAEYNTAQGRPPFPPFLTVTESFTFPLTYQPGTSWQYSSGIDWAGLLISRVAGMSLEEYTQKNIASPLGIDDMTYSLAGKPDLQSRLVSIVNRDPSIPDGKGKVVASEGPGFLSQVKEELGGAGLHTSAHSYIKILHSLLANDENLLKRETVDSMFEPQLTPASQRALQATFDHIPRGETGSAPPFIGEFAQVQHDFGLGGMLSMEDVDSGSKKWRRKGYMFWSGMANWYWFIDREAGLCGIFGTQVMPNADEQVRKMISVFEKGMYDRFAFA